MLDTDTKRRIDTARDILVGKVPDPKSQVEQITIALIYKFMDDMDAEAEELGGIRKFFAGEYVRYGWAKLMRSGLGGHEVLHLYAEAIAKMPENAGIPSLFRDIFKNAYLPYRDPETLRAFLKIIDEFEYDHSERLGDAFEYLLSVLGSQGDAGQFRTPRHIIDFMVEIIDPQKTESVLDPACGTAGFLISSYKHILKSNTDEHGNSTLTPDERGRMSANFKGYDISPDMVRLSLVNLYLHGFSDPHVYEYDSLTSQDRWNEYADVILANPPFMSPKGGIVPHNRFSVQSKRSEVLFVDYIAEHLSNKGRAGVIVPEGIIFQSQTAYKQLRKMLVEDYLIAVISLPAGVFNPYSGVKTSILVLDKALASKTDTIAFFKVENDGFGLGAQRKPIDKNDLPATLQDFKNFRRSIEDGSQVDANAVRSTAQIVSKMKIAANGEYNLSGERYRETQEDSSVFPLVPLNDLAKIKNGFAFRSEEYVQEGLRVIRIKNVQKGLVVDTDPKFIATERQQEFAEYGLDEGDIVISLTGNVGRVGRLLPEHLPAVLNQRVAQIQLRSDVKCSPEYLFAMLNTDRFENSAVNASSGAAQANLSSKWIANYCIPLPPLDIQHQLVAEIESYQKVIDGARAVVENYKPRIDVKPEWEMVRLGEIVKPEYGHTESAADEGDARFIRITDISPDGKLRSDASKFITLTNETRKSLLQQGDILVARTGATYGKTMIFEESYNAVFASFLIRLRFPQNRVLSHYYWAFAQSALYWQQANALMTGGGQPQFNGNALTQIIVPLPPLAEQRSIVEEIVAEQSLVDANRELIERMEKKIEGVLKRVWGEG